MRPAKGDDGGNNIFLSKGYRKAAQREILMCRERRVRVETGIWMLF